MEFSWHLCFIWILFQLSRRANNWENSNLMILTQIQSDNLFIYNLIICILLVLELWVNRRRRGSVLLKYCWVKGLCDFSVRYFIHLFGYRNFKHPVWILVKNLWTLKHTYIKYSNNHNLYSLCSFLSQLEVYFTLVGDIQQFMVF